MEKSLTRKVAGGKLFRLDISYNLNIDSVKLTGDFFLHPEDFIYKIERALVGLDINSSAEEIVNELNNKLGNSEYDLIGISFEDIGGAVYDMFNPQEATEE